MGTHWIVEGTVDARWPINTRGNVGEVFPEVLTPLTYELVYGYEWYVRSGPRSVLDDLGM